MARDRVYIRFDKIPKFLYFTECHWVISSCVYSGSVQPATPSLIDVSKKCLFTITFVLFSRFRIADLFFSFYSLLLLMKKNIVFVIRYHTDIPFRCYDLASIPFYCETQFDNSTTNETKLNLITFQCYFMYFSLKNEFYAESVKGGSSIPSVPATGILLATTRLPHTVHTLTDSFEFFFFFFHFSFQTS